MISSNAFERWLISSTDMPTPGRASSSCCACSSTSSGSTAGPAEKLKRRVVVVVGITVLDARAARSQANQLEIQDVRVLVADALAERALRLAVEIDAGDGR